MGLDRPLDQIKQADLQELVDNRVAEKRVIDYKRELHFSTDGERKEFLFDVASFANAAGGHLVYGVPEVDGYPENLAGLTVPREDELVRQIESIVRDGIAPRPRVETALIPLDHGGVIVLLRIPASWAKPHMVTFKGTNKFYGRDSRGKFPLDVTEIRAAFALGATAAEKARQFRVDRLTTILGGGTTPTLNVGPTTIVHLVPLEAFQPGAAIKPLPRPDDLVGLRPIRSGGWNPTSNFDGIICHGGGWGAATAPTYVQLFRSGIMEAATTWSSPMSETADFPSVAYEREILATVPTYLQVQRDLGVQPPILVMLTLARMKGISMAVNPRETTGFERPFAESEMLVPEAVLETFDDDLGSILKPLFDIVWNAAGYPASLNFDRYGNWIKRP